MASFTSVELGWDTCAFARTSVSRGEVHLSAAEVLDPAAFPGTDAFTAALLRTRRLLSLPRRCRVVLWGLPDGATRKDASVKPLLEPLAGAGFKIERVVSPCNALAALARRKGSRGDGSMCWLAINRGGVAVVVVCPGRLLYSHSFAWDSSAGATGSQARLLQRYLLVSFLAPQVKHAMAQARKAGTPVDAVVTCGNLPDLRSLTMPLIEELDIEVETLDSLDGLVVKPQAAEKLKELAPAIRLACAAAIARATRPWDPSKKPSRWRTWGAYLRAGAVATAVAGVAYGWYVKTRPSAPFRPAAQARAQTAPALIPRGATPVPKAPASSPVVPNPPPKKPDTTLPAASPLKPPVVTPAPAPVKPTAGSVPAPLPNSKSASTPSKPPVAGTPPPQTPQTQTPATLVPPTSKAPAASPSKPPVVTNPPAPAKPPTVGVATARPAPNPPSAAPSKPPISIPAPPAKVPAATVPPATPKSNPPVVSVPPATAKANPPAVSAPPSTPTSNPPNTKRPPETPAVVSNGVPRAPLQPLMTLPSPNIPPVAAGRAPKAASSNPPVVSPVTKAASSNAAVVGSAAKATSPSPPVVTLPAKPAPSNPPPVSAPAKTAKANPPAATARPPAGRTALNAPAGPADKPEAGRAPRPPSPSVPRGPMPALLTDAVPKVSAILVERDRRFATVEGGQIIGIGDLLGRRTVVAMDERSVVFQEPSGVQIRIGLGGRLLRIERGGR